MPLHLLKLCVGVETIQDLADWIEESRLHAGRLGRPYAQTHVTRMIPKRAAEIAGEGSLYWVIKGWVACRQSVQALAPFTDAAGIGRCRIVLEPVVQPVAPRPCRPFQGWRYLTAADAPPDLALGTEAGLDAMPEGMRRELAALGLL